MVTNGSKVKKWSNLVNLYRTDKMIKSSPCEAWEKNGKELFGCCMLQVGCAGIAGLHGTGLPGLELKMQGLVPEFI